MKKLVFLQFTKVLVQIEISILFIISWFNYTTSQWFRYENNCTFTKFSILENFVSCLRNNKDERSK